MAISSDYVLEYTNDCTYDLVRKELDASGLPRRSSFVTPAARGWTACRKLLRGPQTGEARGSLPTRLVQRRPCLVAR